jgi:hypothetical protein
MRYAGLPFGTLVYVEKVRSQFLSLRQLAQCRVFTLKDYAVTEQLKGIGVFISLFAIGFILAAVGTVALSINRNAMLTWVTHGGERPKLGFWSATLPLLLSIMCLFGAVLLIVFKFHSL